MTFILEINGPFQWLPGKFRGTVGRKTFRRVWWFWFALAWTPLSLPEYQREIESGTIEWTIGKKNRYRRMTMTAKQALYHCSMHVGYEPMIGYVVQWRLRDTDNAWTVMGLNWDTLEDAVRHSEDLWTNDREDHEYRIAKITYVVVKN
jgi:hypothetical protein